MGLDMKKKSEQQEMQGQREVLLVIPARDEAENLAWLLPEVIARRGYRVIVVDNGSRDGTAQVARELGALVIVHPKLGYGGAVGAAFREILHNSELREGLGAVVVFDADGSSPVDAISQVVRPVLTGKADLSIGQRVSKEKGAMPLHADFGNELQTFLIRLFTGYSYLDMGPLRALSLEALAKLNMRDRTWGWNVEMQIKSAVLGFRVHEIPIVYKKRRYGRSKISGSLLGSMRAGLKILFAVVFYTLLARVLVFRQSSRQSRFAEHL